MCLYDKGSISGAIGCTKFGVFCYRLCDIDLASKRGKEAIHSVDCLSNLKEGSKNEVACNFGVWNAMILYTYVP